MATDRRPKSSTSMSNTQVDLSVVNTGDQAANKCIRHGNSYVLFVREYLIF